MVIRKWRLRVRKTGSVFRMIFIGFFAALARIIVLLMAERPETMVYSYE